MRTVFAFKVDKVVKVIRYTQRSSIYVEKKHIENKTSFHCKCRLGGGGVATRTVRLIFCFLELVLELKKKN